MYSLYFIFIYYSYHIFIIDHFIFICCHTQCRSSYGTTIRGKEREETVKNVE